MVSSSAVNTFHSKNVDENPRIAVDNFSEINSQLIMEIHKRFADYLVCFFIFIYQYSKSDYATSVNHYIRTITHLSPSYVILKFVDPSHIVYLTMYLQALHDSKISTESHTSLLLNCYSKLKDEDSINKLISQGGFNIESGIRICRTAGYFKQALVLAKASSLHDWVINILFEDLNESIEVIPYIAQLDPNSIELTFKKYGTTLVKHLPKESTDILVFLCTTELHVHPEDFISFYVDSITWCVEFLERVFSTRFSNHSREYDVHFDADKERISRSIVSNTLFELYLENYGDSNEIKCNILEEKSLQLLKDVRNGIDFDYALILCKRHNLHVGILYILETNSRYKIPFYNRYEEMLEYYHLRKEYEAVLEICRKIE
jgi:hypothetical protein